MKNLSVSAFCVLYFVCSVCPTFFPLNAEADIIDSKFLGKVSLALVLAGVGIATKLMIHNEDKKVQELRKAFGKADKIVQVERGFDFWTIEYYGETKLLFQNGTFQKRE